MRHYDRVGNKKSIRHDDRTEKNKTRQNAMRHHGRTEKRKTPI
jgi:hypothetical protein